MKENNLYRYGFCKVCGCTDFDPCEKNCYWVDDEHDLCSNCSDYKYKITKQIYKLTAKSNIKISDTIIKEEISSDIIEINNDREALIFIAGYTKSMNYVPMKTDDELIGKIYISFDVNDGVNGASLCYIFEEGEL
jgi:hypothetical protein